MSFSIFDKLKDNTSIMIDIGNGSIAGAIVSFSGKEKPRVLYSVRMSFDIDSELNLNRLLENMLFLLDKMLADIVKSNAKSKRITGALVSFSSPWFILKTKNIHIENDKAFIITEDFLGDVVEKEKIMLEKEFAGAGQDNGQGDSVEVIDRNIIHTKINGYSIQKNIGKRTKIFDAVLCLSVISKHTADKVFETLSKHTHISRDKIMYHSFPLISFFVLRDVFYHDNDFIIMDVAGESTDMSLISEGFLMKTVSFLSGRNFILRQISKNMGVSSEIAESTLHLYSSKKLDSSVSEQVSKILSDAENEWSLYLEDALANLSPTMVLPTKIYMTADEDVAWVYTEFLKQSKTDRTASFRKNLNVVHVNNDIISHIYDNHSGKPVDEFIGLLSIFYDKILRGE